MYTERRGIRNLADGCRLSAVGPIACFSWVKESETPFALRFSPEIATTSRIAILSEVEET